MSPAIVTFSGLKNIKTDVSSLMFYVMILLAMSIPLSEFGMSISQFLLLALWVHEGADFCRQDNAKRRKLVTAFAEYFKIIGENLAGKFRRLLNNPAALVVISFYLLHVAGLLYTSDLDYALKDLRIKLPLLSLPVIISSSASLSKDRLNRLLAFFTIAVFAGTTASIYVLLTRHVSDPREISIFISHIRFGLTICFSIFILVYFLYKQYFGSRFQKTIITLGIIWFFIFLIILESVTGLAITLMIIFIFILVASFRIKSWFLKLAVLLPVVVFPYFAVQYFIQQTNQFNKVEPVNFQKLDKYTRYGTPYIHDTCGYGIEKGKYVGIYIAQAELRQEWNRRSNLSFDGQDNKGQVLSYTLIRFLSSKGLRKDADGVRSLTDREIAHIENGVANVAYLENFSFRSRIDQMAMGYTNYVTHGESNASSLMQRVEYWRTSTYIIKQYWLSGVGTGDLNEAFSKAYQEMGSKLDDAFRNRSHNQFLAVFVAFGVIGFILFLFSLFYPPFKTGWYSDYYFLVFFTIVFMSMLTEDTLETQAGATFFAFFNSLLLFGRKRDQAEPYKKTKDGALLKNSLHLDPEFNQTGMKTKEITIKYSETEQASDLEPADGLLLESAAGAAKMAYAPYSGFRVGAALRLENKSIITGNNQENAAYPSGLCAERVAIFYASSQYPGAIIESIAITVNTDQHKITEPVPPCGACRQVIAEYEKKQGRIIRIIFASETGKIIQVDGIDHLLPMSFNSNNLQHR
ncbi:MAG: cytidine deaminase [Lentimicrobium sp.]